MTTAHDDLILANAVAAGDKTATDLFAEKFRQKLVYLAKKRSIPYQDCEDIAHETLLTAINQLRRGLFRGESTLGTWLERILSGKIADYWRNKLSKDLPSEVRTDSNADVFEMINQDQASLQSDPVLRIMVQEVLSKMTVKHRRILLLNQVDGYTIKDISKLLGWPAGTVGRILAEAKIIFRDLVLGVEEFRD
jgi:RNA polymerase sigma factor (sigma-70 family)